QRPCPSHLARVHGLFAAEHGTCARPSHLARVHGSPKMTCTSRPHSAPGGGRRQGTAPRRRSRSGRHRPRRPVQGTVLPTESCPFLGVEPVGEFASPIAPDRQAFQVPAQARWSPFDDLVFGLFFGEARPPTNARTSATRCTLVTLGP